MKRMNVIVDEELLEDARRATGERTYSATINRALAEVSRVHRLRKGLEELRELAKEGPLFREGYLAEIRPNAYDVPERKKRVAAHEQRLPRKKSKRRVSR